VLASTDDALASSSHDQPLPVVLHSQLPMNKTLSLIEEENLEDDSSHSLEEDVR
jgi:hypothetical protein